MAKNLVIVESPAKAKTINRYLGRDYQVKASMGHVRDLPKNPKRKGKGMVGGVDVARGFEVEYEILPTRRKIVGELRAAAKKADAVFLAADPDREGEAICWHLSEALGLTGASRKKLRRVVFNEITKRAVAAAFESPREVDARKVDAQQTRRILDRLVGYAVSPILWEKVRRGLSAGRVQSVALKLICDRERAIKAFESVEYWTVAARLAGPKPPPFVAQLAKHEGKKIEIGDADAAARVRRDLDAARFEVSSVVAKERRRRPVPAFTTSKLQQDAFKKLRFSVKKTMQVAQRLYEGIELGRDGSVGLITYMRTDSTRVAGEALLAAREHIAQAYGPEYLPDKPIHYKSKKDAQDAHEAIRPTDLQYDPESIKRYLGRDEYRLYKLIWSRFVASQMLPAVYDETLVEITAGAYLLKAKGSVLKFKGFLAAYEETPDEEPATPPGEHKLGQDDTEPETTEGQLPVLAVGDALELHKLETDQHFTQPPPRFSEASLVKELEENGIGRPSTYASILATIQARDYTQKEQNRLYPTELGFVVADLLVEHFKDIMNVEYTAAMEAELDQIEAGQDNLLNTLSQFWKKFEKDLSKAQHEMKDIKRLEEKTDEVCEKCGSAMVIKWGRYGKFLACSGYPECRNTRQLAAAEGGEDLELEEEALSEVCPADSQPMVVKKGRYGAFLACSRYPDCKQTKKLVRGKEGRLKVEQLAPLDEACPECSNPLAWRRGRFGPFIACSNYPSCKYIKKKEARDIGMLCPECGEGQVVERKGRWGRLFYGCRRYPECKFTAYHLPVAEPCPECGRAYLLQKETKKEGTLLFCANEDCGFKKSVAA